MKYDPNVHHRRSIRLKGYDYTEAGEYFITICVKDRECPLGSIESGVVKLSGYGEIVKKCWVEILHHFENAELDDFVIMPDHMHGIIRLVDLVGTRHAASQRGEESKTEQFGRPVQGSIPTIVRCFKSAATKRIHDSGHQGMMWQSRFYERIIRGDKELHAIQDYIRNNPAKWDEEKNRSAGVMH